jgi:hypothetical protein
MRPSVFFNRTNIIQITSVSWSLNILCIMFKIRVFYSNPVLPVICEGWHLTCSPCYMWGLTFDLFSLLYVRVDIWPVLPVICEGWHLTCSPYYMWELTFDLFSLLYVRVDIWPVLPVICEGWHLTCSPCYMW